MNGKISSRQLKKREKSSSIAPQPGLFLAQKRIEAKIARQDIAKYMGISLSTLDAYEAGTKAIPLHQVYSYSNLLNISPDSITELLDKSYSTKLKSVK